jgi:hypothetical protein
MKQHPPTDEPDPGRDPRWLDIDDQAPTEGIPPEDHQLWADHLWVGSLLEEAHRPSGETERAVEHHLEQWRLATLPTEGANKSVAGQVGTGPAIPPGREPNRRHWLISALSISAALASVFVLWSISSGTASTAQAAYLRAKEQAFQPVDRTYRITFDLPSPSTIQADLYLRGPRELALAVAGPLDSTTWIGTTRERSWLAPAVGPVFVAKDFQPVLEKFFQRLQLPAMSLRIADVLQTLEKDYSLELGSDQTIPAFGRTPARQVIARKREGFRPLLPMKVTFWTHPDTGVVGRLILDWSGQLEHIAVRQVTFELRQQRPLPDAWYDHTSHHEPLRPVLLMEVPARRETSASPTP